MDQCIDWLTNPPSVEEVPNIDWLIAIFQGIKKNDGKPYPGIKYWAQTLKALKDLLKKIFNLQGSLVFCPYRFPYEMKELSGISNIHRG